MDIGDIKHLMWSQEYDRALLEVEVLRDKCRDCPSIWILRGDLIQLAESADTPPLEEAAVSYKKALEIDPNNLEALESLAHFYDAVVSEPANARQYAQACIQKIELIRSAMQNIVSAN